MKLATRVLLRFSNCLALLAAFPLIGFAQFTPAPGSPFAAGVFPGFTVGDFNGDGKLDLAGVNPADNTVSVLLGTDKGGFVAASGKAIALEVGSSILTVADFNRDGKSDLAIITGTTTVTVLLGDNTGGFRIAPGSPF